MAASDPQVHIEIGSRAENIELVQIAVEASLRQLQLDEESAHSIGAAVREAVANAVEHGNTLDPEKKVEVEFGLEGEDVVIRVSDQGAGFDVAALVDPTERENLLRPNGRGIFLMKSFMDEIDYTFRPGQGTLVTLRKHVDLPAARTNEDEEDKR